MLSDNFFKKLTYVAIWGWATISGPWNPGFQDSRSALDLANFD